MHYQAEWKTQYANHKHNDRDNNIKKGWLNSKGRKHIEHRTSKKVKKKGKTAVSQTINGARINSEGNTLRDER